MAKRKQDYRQRKMLMQRKLKGWNTKCNDWEDLVYDSVEKVVKVGLDGRPVTPEEKAVLFKVMGSRVGAYERMATIMGVTKNNGEASWVVQLEVIFQRNMLEKLTDGKLSQEDAQDLMVHNLKYWVELAYNKEVGFEELKKYILDNFTVEIPEGTFADIEDYYYNTLVEMCDFLEKDKALDAVMTDFVK